MSKYANQIIVSLEALRKNIRIIQDLIDPNNFFYPFIKSNAYGLGVNPVLSILHAEGFSEFGILNVQEAQAISNSDVKLLLFGPMDDVSSIVQNSNWIPVIHSWEDLKLFSQVVLKNKKKHHIHIKINIGMARLGFEISDVESLISYLKQRPYLKLEGICGHLPCGEDIGIAQGESQKQIDSFRQQVKKFKKYFSDIKPHLYNSYSLVGAFTHDIHLPFGCRIGGCIYGVKPLVHFATLESQSKWKQLELSPVSTLKSQIVSARIVPKNQGVSYSWNWKASKDSNIAVVGIGYADGVWKSLKNGYVLFREKKAPIVGEICMNFFMIDLTQILGSTLPQAGEEVVIYGIQGAQSISLNEWAKHTHSTPYELMTNIGFSVNRVYSN